MPKFMKKFILILFAFIFFLQSNAQNKTERRIYIWDVTLSMKGFLGKTPDIYNKIVKFLENEINENPGLHTRAEWIEKLERIEKDARAIRTPLAFSDILYTLRAHIDLVRHVILRRTSA